MQTMIVGTGPAALLAADILSAAGERVRVFERRPSAGWKLLVAGASGLNVSHDGPEHALADHYFARREEIGACLAAYGRADWLAHLRGLGEETFLGTSRRYFLVNKKAGSLLAAWTTRLLNRGVEFHFGEELTDFSSGRATFASGRRETAENILLALGGPSWEQAPPAWPAIFQRRGVQFTPFTPSNAGYSFAAPDGFFALAEGKPIKGLVLRTARGEKAGECMITRYGLEGTPVYTVGCPGAATLDLKPDLTLERLRDRLVSGGRSRLRQTAKLSEGAWLLVEKLQPRALLDAGTLATTLKNFPLELGEPRPLTECISARGGVSWDELSPTLELLRVPGVYCAGEMVDWDAPTGGFLIQASVSMGAVAARGILRSKIEHRG